MKVIGAKTATNGTPLVARIGSTRDGRGVNAFTMLGNDLYLAEAGGLGVSKITDPSGVARPACSATTVCTAVPLNPNPTFFPGGLVTALPTVTSGANAATGVACTNATSCTAVSPPGAGTVDVRVTLGGGTSLLAVAADQFTYVAPPRPRVSP
jgi:hypothetical protein